MCSGCAAICAAHPCRAPFVSGFPERRAMWDGGSIRPIDRVLLPEAASRRALRRILRRPVLERPYSSGISTMVRTPSGSLGIEKEVAYRG
jgi:hypothetical protein